MSIDWQTSLYDAVYNTVGVPAELTSAGGVAAAVTVVDGTSGVVFTDKLGVETVRPVAYIRTSELARNSIEQADLTDGFLDFNGANWRIKATRPRPGPTGSGETMLILLDEGNG
jgi:hypothetical protein